MFSIEELARICGVKIEDIKKLMADGFLKENIVWFNMEDVERVRLVMGLKSFDICKADIKMVIDNKTDLDDILKIKIYEIENRIERHRQRIERISKKRESIMEGNSFVSDIIKLKPVLSEQPEVWICSVRENININAVNSLLKKLQKKMNVYKLKPQGSLIRIFHEQLPNNENADIELGFQVKVTKKTEHEILNRIYAGKVLCTEIIAEYNEISLGYSNLYKWIKENNYKMIDTPFEYFETVTVSKNGEIPDIQIDIAKEPFKFKVKLCIPVSDK